MVWFRPASGTQSVPRILLPLLLCLSLIAGAVGSVWSATVMAMPMDTMSMTMDAGHDCCHEEASLQCADDGGDATAASCADGNHCDCKQHCNMLPSTAMVRVGNMHHALAPVPPVPSRYDVAPGELNRPPIV
jgi:hypothetical protein